MNNLSLYVTVLVTDAGDIPVHATSDDSAASAYVQQVRRHFERGYLKDEIKDVTVRVLDLAELLGARKQEEQDSAPVGNNIDAEMLDVLHGLVVRNFQPGMLLKVRDVYPDDLYPNGTLRRALWRVAKLYDCVLSPEDAGMYDADIKLNAAILSALDSEA
jgi:hypothetical protein